jgi:hypothetical protein
MTALQLVGSRSPGSDVSQNALGGSPPFLPEAGLAAMIEFLT